MSLILTWEWDESQLPAYLQRLDLTCDVAARDAAVNVAALAHDAVAVDTGSLQDTIDFEQIAPMQYGVSAGNTTGGYKGGRRKPEGSPVDYAVHQEYNGTPFMTPASEVGWQQYQNDLAVKIGALQ